MEKGNGAIQKEMDFLIKNGTWLIVDKPEGQKVIGYRLLFKLKWEYQVGVESMRYKSRLVTRGFTQKEGIDYQKKFAPVVKHISIRILMHQL